MPAKKVVYEEEARTKLKAGVDKLANAVRVTLGPKGRNVAIQKSYGAPHITKDGVSIAKEIELSDAAENMGAKIVMEAASKTVDTVGDGTTTAVVIAQAIIHEGLKNVTAGANPMEIRTGIEKGVAAVIAKLNKSKKEVKGKEDITKVATISANGDTEIGEILGNIIDKVGKEGVVTVEEGKTLGLEEKYVEGMQFDKGYISPYFAAKSEDLKAEIENPVILITDKKISAVKDFMPILEKVAASGKRDVAIIAEDVDGEALSTLILNYLKGTLNVVAVKAPAFGDRRKAMLQDIAILTGGSVITEELGKDLESMEMDDLGTAEKIIVTKDDTTIVGGKGSKTEIAARVEAIKKEIVATSSDYDREKLQERLAKLTGGVAVLEVGAPTEVELKERKDRIEDALSATRAAIEEGIVAGGGVALLDAVSSLDDVKTVRDEQIGVNILRSALEEPFRRILLNAGKDPAAWRRDVGKGKGYDAREEKVVDMVENGIIDPVKVTRLALENAASAAMMLITTEAVVTEVPEPKEPAAPAPDMGGMGMM
ncbi:chaperonin GroEL [Candidatus Dojkabacteria bacterium]|uniref:Chaperonin GroEL n=1 Tax=Candidatus Dojkabacteria bacterium TaxID=2099670 RepID=A0A955I604_9BACT|nr:chaperonin GroEL [Candidatus Dojkabacteria bacterium]